MSSGDRDLKDKIVKWQKELKSDVDTIKLAQGDHRDRVEHLEAEIKKIGSDSPESTVSRLTERVSKLEVSANRRTQFGGRADARKMFGGWCTKLNEYTRAISQQDSRVSIREKLVGGIHRALIADDLQRRALTDIDVSGLIFTFQDTADVAKLKMFNRPFIRTLIPSVRISTDSYEYSVLKAQWHLSQLITATANSGQPDVVINNAVGVMPGTEVTLSPGKAEEETLIVDSVDLDTNTVTMTTNLTNTHTVSSSEERRLVSDHFRATPKTKLKPTGQLVWDKASGNIKTIATTMDIARQCFEDAPRFEDEMNQELPDHLQRQFDYMALYGNGGTQEFEGVFVNDDVPTWTWSTDGFPGDTRVDAIRRALTIQSLSNREPEWIHIHPSDLEALDLTKGADKHYVQKLMIDNGALRLWRVPVAEDRSLNATDFLIANWTRGAKVYDREQANLMISSEHADYFARNMLFLRFEERLDLAIREPAAFVAGKLDNAPAP